VFLAHSGLAQFVLVVALEVQRRHREASQQVNDPQSLPAHEVARVRPDAREQQ
jgi:hypothetical protein